MARLGPWDADRRVAVAVSGGADSLALALLAAGWGSPTAFIVDHGLRADSAAEAEQTRAVLGARDIPAHVLTLRDLQPGPGMPARARAARYAAMEAAVAAAGLVDLLLGHHAGDQAETVLMRQAQGSGPRGLAGMAALAEGKLVRRLRPLLAIHPARLRATLRAVGQDWVEDPTNHDQRYTRARLRARLGGALDGPLADAARHTAPRAALDQAVARILAERVSFFPERYAVLSPGPLDPAALAALLQAISGRPFAPSLAAVTGLAADLCPATLAGVRILPAGRLGPGWLLVREVAAMAPPVPQRPGAVWDGRFRVSGAASPPGQMLGALGEDAADYRGCGLPTVVLRTLPALRHDGVLSAVQLPAYIGQTDKGSEIILGHCGSPACGAPFMA
jgi:tRNA(Ile)-lysidine synthase